ncbi:4-amino-4-deoxy-L-arabinose-phosphoundecaprenol flippase subunit ArnF [Paenibacillus konkukensis]|uniref:4-amino-4-deoxy-L-arabinose-phosphoundecaprenol flippase subunit ArnF n=1 Tax=Paenibacillus konkukensis TaxID=2020716 RepID=A0ABY4S145_9BACL|nr:SMR family transporter [Paenibacillus konkukensis]UQZ87610.1 4-amino-4-deoxy-L-arabinose-phosphoundecaprenol flippase subunit ArnF [Paenibacillus konkukensis]
MKIWMLIVASVLLGSVGQVILKLGAGRLGSFGLTVQTMPADMVRLAKTPEIWMGLLLFGASFLLWVKVLTRAELSYAYPMAGLGYVNVALLSYFLFGETFTWNKLLGIAIIVLGIMVINK